MDRERLLAELAALIEKDAQAAETILEYLRQRDGAVGLMLRVLSRRPELFAPHVLQGIQIYDTPKAIDPKTAELAAVAASAALMCEYCLARAHARRPAQGSHFRRNLRRAVGGRRDCRIVHAVRGLSALSANGGERKR